MKERGDVEPTVATTGNGFDGIVHHGSDRVFHAFRVDPDRGVFFSGDVEYSRGCGENIYRCRVVLKNPRTFTETESMGDMEIDRNVLIAQGYDGRIVRYDDGAVDVIAFHPGQITMVDSNWRQIIFRKLSEHPLSRNMRVFGSAATPDADANDIDVFLDCPGPAGRTAGLDDILELARRHYGRLDPFVLRDGVLWTRNDDATGWVRARNAAALIAAGREGVSLDDASGVDFEGPPHPKP